MLGIKIEFSLLHTVQLAIRQRSIRGSMTSSTFPATQFSADEQIWHSLKCAISRSSGFQRWQLERQIDEKFQSLTLDLQVQKYLRETLETLAY